MQCPMYLPKNKSVLRVNAVVIRFQCFAGFVRDLVYKDQILSQLKLLICTNIYPAYIKWANFVYKYQIEFLMYPMLRGPWSIYVAQYELLFILRLNWRFVFIKKVNNYSLMVCHRREKQKPPLLKIKPFKNKTWK